MKPSRSAAPRSPHLLPPIVANSETPSSSGIPASPSRSTRPSGSGAMPWSYYHRGCLMSDPAISFSSNTEEKKKTQVKNGGHKSRSPPLVPSKDMLIHNKSRSPPLVPSKASVEADSKGMSAESVEAYVLDYVPLIDVERWLFQKLSRIYNTEMASDGGLPTSKSILKICQKQRFMELIKTLHDDPDENAVIWELARCISESIGVDAYRVYKIVPENSGEIQCFEVDRTNLTRVDFTQTTLVLETAKTGTPWRLTRGQGDRFPETPRSLFESFNIEDKWEAISVLYQPIITAAGITAYVIEMWRIKDPFGAPDQDTSSNFLVWGSLALHYCSLYLHNKIESNMSEFLLNVVKAIFEEMVSLDQLIKRILEFAQRLVSADRASLFLVDFRNFELVSTVFDLKFEPGQTMDVEKKEIRMPINRGIAGHVALSGETMNIPDAYADYRFNREVDEATGYKTVNILCMPIKVQGKVIGVVQMVNKRNENSFHREDEIAFEIFSTFFGLALHHARLYDRIMRKEQKYRVALEVLSYHNTCRENEVQAVMGDKDQVPIDLNNFYLDPYKLNEFQKCKAVITMFDDLFDLSKFDVSTVTRFVLTVKKNYRTVPYHNFDHGWSVAHAMYAVLKHDIRGRFDYKMRLALFVACLCHDLDHRGYTNKYMSETASPLAAMYTTSTLEHHHFNITVTILQQDRHNIFSHMSSEEFKEILGYIRQCILATDLAAFFPNLAKMKELHAAESSHGKFSWATPGHRDLAMAISMTAADLSASAKPWEVQIKTVKVIFEEFYDQGDKERAAGRTPIPMMDRNVPDEQPSSQVGFLSQICMPCYSMLYRILPNTKPMYVMALKNLYYWKSKAARILDKQNGIEAEELEMEDVSEEVLLEGEPEIVEEDEVIEEKGTQIGEVLKKESSVALSSEDEETLIRDVHNLVGEIALEKTLEDDDAYDVIIKDVDESLTPPK